MQCRFSKKVNKKREKERRGEEGGSWRDELDGEERVVWVLHLR